MANRSGLASETGPALEWGRGAYVGEGFRVVGDGRVVVGDDVILGPGVTIHATSDEVVEIGAGAWLGAEVVVHAGVRIGAGAFVRSGSEVVEDVPMYALAAGTPAARVERILEMGAGCGPRTLATLTKLGVRVGRTYAIRSPFVITVGRNTTLGEAISIGPGCEIHDHGQVLMGRNVVLEDGVKVFAGTKGVRVGDGARIGAGAVLRPGAVVEDGAVVPAGRVVGDGEVVAGAAAVIGREEAVVVEERQATTAQDQADAAAGTDAPVFHVTHWKAGSQWVRAVLNAAAGDRIVPLREDMSHFLNRPIAPGGVYTPLYVRADNFRRVMPKNRPQRTFVVVRDPRDTLISFYFSMKISHSDGHSGQARARALLQNSDVIDGLAIMLREQLYDVVAIQTTWQADGAKIVRYEDLLADQHGGFADLLDFCGIDLPEERRRFLVETNSFEAATGGRPRGTEDVTHHQRKGIAGDWRNHFDERLTRLFKRYYGEALVQLGYERDLEW